MKHIQQEKDSYIKNVERFIDKLKKADNGFDIEGYIYTIQMLSKRAYGEINAINSTGENI